MAGKTQRKELEAPHPLPSRLTAGQPERDIRLKHETLFSFLSFFFSIKHKTKNTKVLFVLLTAHITNHLLRHPFLGFFVVGLPGEGVGEGAAATHGADQL